MGKIFKALEKAEKQTVTKPVKRPVPDRRRLEREVAISPANSKQAVRSEKHQMADRVRHDKNSVEIKADTEPFESSVLPPTRKPLHLTAEPVETPTEPNVTQRLEKISAHENDTPAVDPQAPFGESKSVFKPDSGQKTDKVDNVTLVKPENAKPLHPEQPLARGSEAEARSTDTAVTGKTTSAKKVQVSYSKTKVQSMDLEKLKNNKVLSVFEDIETTNQFKMLRTQVLRKLKAVGGNSILVTSANPV